MPEIMIPLVMDPGELEELRTMTFRVAEDLFHEQECKVDFMVGTMIELPRAVLLAEQIAAHADFFSFGTNDLTQTAMGLSRDDAGRFLPTYIDKGIFPADPFASLDQSGVGKLVEMGKRDGRKAKPELKVGICGEHGGDPASIEFCYAVGLDYVSCSPYRVPIARVAAAQAAIRAGV
jgi:pyruvate,orthophosphate dikinase